MSEKIMTLHPEGKSGVNIDKSKYDTIRSAVLEVLTEHETYPFNTLADEVAKKVGDSFEGSFGWYTTTVKLDLEARGEVERIPDQSPQMLRISQS